MNNKTDAAHDVPKRSIPRFVRDKAHPLLKQAVASVEVLIFIPLFGVIALW